MFFFFLIDDIAVKYYFKNTFQINMYNINKENNMNDENFI